MDYSKNKFLVVSNCSWSFLNRSVLLFLSFTSILFYFQHSLCNIVMSCWWVWSWKREAGFGSSFWWLYRTAESTTHMKWEGGFQLSLLCRAAEHLHQEDTVKPWWRAWSRKREGETRVSSSNNLFFSFFPHYFKYVFARKIHTWVTRGHAGLVIEHCISHINMKWMNILENER